mmetsp:Transcript_45270/g.84009  ORF Transcript_45270/g.84009 Transcript_45270/m.84009 type:complete len:207 (+) Transcript_45270:108-728(+)
MPVLADIKVYHNRQGSKRLPLGFWVLSFLLAQLSLLCFQVAPFSLLCFRVYFNAHRPRACSLIKTPQSHHHHHRHRAAVCFCAWVTRVAAPVRSLRVRTRRRRHRPRRRPLRHSRRRNRRRPRSRRLRRQTSPPWTPQCPASSLELTTRLCLAAACFQASKWRRWCPLHSGLRHPRVCSLRQTRRFVLLFFLFSRCSLDAATSPGP